MGWPWSLSARQLIRRAPHEIASQNLVAIFGGIKGARGRLPRYSADIQYRDVIPGRAAQRRGPGIHILGRCGVWIPGSLATLGTRNDNDKHHGIQTLGINLQYRRIDRSIPDYFPQSNEFSYRDATS